MNILDSTAIVYAFSNELVLEDEYFITDDLDQEFEVAEVKHNVRRGDVILNIKQFGSFDLAFYLKVYQTTLNKHEGHSFSKMSGFGDVSIVTLVECVLDNFGKQVQGKLDLFGEGEVEVVNVFTSDKRLQRHLKREFGDRVVIKSNEELR